MLLYVRHLHRPHLPAQPLEQAEWADAGDRRPANRQGQATTPRLLRRTTAGREVGEAMLQPVEPPNSCRPSLRVFRHVLRAGGLVHSIDNAFYLSMAACSGQPVATISTSSSCSQLHDGRRHSDQDTLRRQQVKLPPRRLVLYPGSKAQRSSHRSALHSLASGPRACPLRSSQHPAVDQ